MDFLIFGASGFLGSRILDFLRIRGDNVSLGTNSADLINSKFQTYQNYYDLNDKDLENIVAKYQTIIDASGISSNKIDHDTTIFLDKNAIWPYRLANACMKANSKLIWLSTIHCSKYENKSSTDFDKYSFSKLIGELLIKKIKDWDQKILILRLGNVIGAPGKNYNGSPDLFALDIAKNLVKNKKAVIQNENDLTLKATSFNELIEFLLKNKYGQYSLITRKNFKLSDIAFCVKERFEFITKSKASLFHRERLIKNKTNLISDEFDKDIDELIRYFLNIFN